MNKHTPGPWQVISDDHPEAINKNLEVVAGSNILCKIGGGLLDVRTANARLIAAAPDLLAALQSILNISLMDNGHWAKTIEVEASTAIAKAKGE